MPLLGAMLHPPLGWLIQKGEKEGVPMSVTAAVGTLATVLVFVIYLRPDWSVAWSALDLLALLNGTFFFGGAWFAIRAVKAGDLVVHTSTLGIKLFIVAGLSIAIGLEKGSPELVGAVVLAAVAIFLLAGGTLKGWKSHRATLGWTLVGTTFFGMSDTLAAWKASEIGTARWLFLMVVGSGLCAVVVLIPRIKLVERAFKRPNVRWILGGLGLIMGVQAILVNTAFTVYREPMVSNIVFSSRGLMTIPFLMLVHRSWRGIVDMKMLAGAVLMLVAIVLAAWH